MIGKVGMLSQRLFAWDVSTASYVQSFSVAAQDTQPSGLFFKPDGLKMYVVGFSGNDVNEYSLSTAWDVSSASYDQSLSLASEGRLPYGIFFKPDGSRMFVVHDSSNNVNEYSLSTAWDVSSASYDQSFSVAAEGIYPYGLSFKPDGAKMFIVHSENDNKVSEYSLATAWDVSTASYVQNFSVTAQDNLPFGLFFKPDGLKMYVVGYDGNDVNEYSLGTAWDISTASYVQNFSVLAQEASPVVLFFKPDGMKMYVVGVTGDNVNEYSLG